MRTSSKAIITASFVLPMFLVACDRAERSPTTGSGSSQEKNEYEPIGATGHPTDGKIFALSG